MALTATNTELKDLLHRKTIATSGRISDLQDDHINLRASTKNLKNQLNDAHKTISDLQIESSMTKSKLNNKLKEIDRLRDELFSKSRLVTNGQEKLNQVIEEKDFLINEKREKTIKKSSF